jgi:hypothetical protein
MLLKQRNGYWALLTNTDHKAILPASDENRLVALGKALSQAMGARHIDIRRDSASGAITKIIWRAAA